MNVIIITGASSGMGREFALQLDRGLSSVDEFWLIARRRERLEELAGQMRHKARLLPMDLTCPDGIRELKETLLQKKPVVRMLINCAGFGMIGDFMKIPSGIQAKEIDLNCRALTEVTHACIPYMRKKSRIIQLASSAAFLPQPGFSVYAASKAYVQHFSKALREELRERGIGVTSVCPGPVRTEFFDRAEQYGATLGIKKYTMVEADRVVRKALADTSRNRAVSVCSFPIQAFHVMTVLVPQGPVIRITQLMKKRGTKE